MATYAVTGGAGFIGSNIVGRLVADGEEVRVIDDFSTGKAKNLHGLESSITLFKGSVCDESLLKDAFAGADYVLHQAALASVQRSVEDPVATNEVNVGGTLKVLCAARDQGVRRVVYASSSAVYGDTPEMPKHEEMAPCPLSPYAVSKLAGEYYCRMFSTIFGLETVSLRYFNVFGPRQSPQSQYAAVVPIFIRRIVEGRSPQVYGDGGQSRDFTYVDNVVEANLLAARAQGAAGAVCNVGCGQRRTLNELLQLLAELTGLPVEPHYGPDRTGDVRHSLADISLARRLIGYEPHTGFEEGIRRTIEYQKNYEL